MDKSIFISYSWTDGSKEGKEQESFIQELMEESSRQGITLLLDKEHVSYRKSIKEFMKKFGEKNGVILLISDKYLKSKYCMYEALQVLKDENYHERIFPVVFEDARIYDPMEISNYIEYWNEKIEQLNKRLISMNSLIYTKPLIDELELYFDIRRLLAKFSSVVSDLNTLSPGELKKDKFNILFNSINNSILHKGLMYNIDVALCIDSRMSSQSLGFIRDFFSLNILELIKYKFLMVNKEVSQVRVEIADISDKINFETRFYNVSIYEELSQLKSKLNQVKVNNGEHLGLKKLERVIKSDWILTGDKRRHIIFVFSESEGVDADLKCFDTLTNLWEENEPLSSMGKRLVIFGPGKFLWEEMATHWENTVHYPITNICDDLSAKRLGFETLIDAMTRSI